MARTDLEQLVYQMSADLRALERANKRALGEVKDSTKKIQREYDHLAADMGRSFGNASLAAGVAFGAIVAMSTKAASDAAETANAFEVAFGKLTPAATKFAESYSNTVGRSMVETQSQMAKTQLILTGIGVNADQALKLTEAIQKRSVDLGSLWNVEDAEAYASILSGISGEAEPIKKFGVALNEAALSAELLRLGFKGNASDAPEAAKAIARLNIILKATTSAEGDAIKTKDGLANQTKAARAEFDKAAVALGQNFLPMATDAAKAATVLLGEFNKMPDSVKVGGLALLGLVAAGGPIAATVEGLIKLTKYAGAARAAVLSVGAATAATPAAGAAAGATAATAAKIGLGGAALSGSLMLGGVAYGAIGVKGFADAVAGGNRVKLVNEIIKDPSRVRKMNDEEIAKLQALLRRDSSRKGEHAQTMYGDFGADTTPAKSALGILAGEAEWRKAQIAKASDPAQFDLTPDLLKALAGGGSGSSSGGKKAKIDLNTKTIEVDESTVFDLLNTLGGVRNVITMPDSNPEGFVSASDRMADVNDALMQSRAETQAFWADTIEGGLWAAFEGGGAGVAQFFARQLAAAMISNMAGSLAKSLTGKGGMGKVGDFFAGFFASGGTIPNGQWGIVNDGGPEAIRAKPGGGIEVMNNRALTSLAGLNRQAASRVVVQDRVVRIVTEASPYFDQRVETVAAPGALRSGAAASEAGAAKATASARVNSRYSIGG